MHRTSSPIANASHNSPAFGGSLLGASGNRFSNSPTSSPHLGQRKLPAEFRSSSSLVERSENHQMVITKTSWIEAARTSTANFKMHGSPVPLVWVLVEDNVIPPNAVPFGEDKIGPLYIARALLEGGLYLGKAGIHLPHALITYGGREHQVKAYEVLVCASQLRWGLASYESVGYLSQGTVILAQQNQLLLQSQQGSAQAGGLTLRETSIGTRLSVNDIPRFMPTLAVVPSVDGELKKPMSPTVNDDLKKLAGYKMVILVDDSFSMEQEQSWTLVREALAGIADFASQYGSQGIDLHFLHHHDSHTNVKTSHKVQHIFDQTHPDGQDTPTAAKLEELISRYLPLVERKHTRHEPIHIVVISDGVASDNDDFPGIILSATHRLNKSQVPHEMFGIQFVQVGTDPDASATLQALGCHLAKESKFRNIVDFTPYDPQQGAFNTQYMLNILLRCINRVLSGGLASWEKHQASERRVDVHQTGGINKVLDNGSPILQEERQAREGRGEVHPGGSINKVLDNGGPTSWEERQVHERRVEHQAGRINKVLDNGGPVPREERQAHERRVEEHQVGGINKVMDNGSPTSWEEGQARERRVEEGQAHEWRVEERQTHEWRVGGHQAGGINKVLDTGGAAPWEECQARVEVHQAGGINTVHDNGSPGSWERRQASERRVEVHEAGGINESGSLASWEERQAYERRVKEYEASERRVEGHEACEGRADAHQGLGAQAMERACLTMLVNVENAKSRGRENMINPG
ncbi:hypothetical protein M405DRAFT_929826 [Rhizopogon salebrosus TDB-379]|nr:hypothetical protein M405DRAFT_929826 [Rhizopogon salebrosus TDB-379]